MWLAINWGYQIIRKPTELFFPVRGALAKTQPETWRQYGPLFNEHSTAVITPHLLAALAQIEGEGNPLAHTYWRSSLTLNPLELYRPASSAVGMFQITDGAFREAKRYCIHNHVVIEDGPWHDLRSCWFNSLYTRVLPGHAIELTAVLLDRGVASVIGRRRNVRCHASAKAGSGRSDPPVRSRGRRPLRSARLPAYGRQRCGDHDVSHYLARVHAMKLEFARLAGRN